MSTSPYDGPEVNMPLADSEAKMLHEKIFKKAYNHEDFIRILTTRSKSQLNATFNHYKDHFGKAISKVCSSFFCLNQEKMNILMVLYSSLVNILEKSHIG